MDHCRDGGSHVVREAHIVPSASGFCVCTAIMAISVIFSTSFLHTFDRKMLPPNYVTVHAV